MELALAQIVRVPAVLSVGACAFLTVARQVAADPTAQADVLFGLLSREIAATLALLSVVALRAPASPARRERA